MPKTPGLIRTLFDFSFSTFVTIRVVRTAYILGVIGAGLSSLGIPLLALARAISRIEPSGVEPIFPPLLALILSPVIFVLEVIVLRVALETIVVLFRIAENTRQIVVQGEGTRTV
jgi:hypothetical protein